ncbi:MAG: hypothetical protein JSW50_07700 [Candidatus Latescibacterota bacterium]|nr:MAG: hypothetical protein JSW50_07700 [Candidatus Latescibacterota bacterium]
MASRQVCIGGVVFLLALSIAETAFPQAWVKSRGEYFLKLYGAYLYTTQEFDSNGELQDLFEEDASKTDASFRDISFVGYLEYGLTDNLTLVTELPFRIFTSEETVVAGPGLMRKVSRTNGGLSDLTVHLRVPILKKSLAWSVQGGIKIPLGYEKVPDNGGPALGTGELDAELTTHAGLSLYPIPAYLSGGVGYRFRGGEFNDEILYDAEAGITLGRLFVKLRVEGVENTHNPPDVAGSTIVISPREGTITTIVVGDQNYVKILPTLSFDLNDNAAITAEAFHTVAGNNTLAGTTYAAGLIFTR